jgi:Protein of unknown function (DUF2948)
MPDTDTALKLVALDSEGLAVISAHVQDSCVAFADLTWLPRQNRFVCAAMRYDWAAAKAGRHERVLTALRFDRVMKVSQLGFGDRDKPRRLLAVRFEKIDAPSGMVLLTFADGAAIRLDVECLEGELSDIGPRKPAEACAGHSLTIADAV